MPQSRMVSTTRSIICRRSRSRFAIPSGPLKYFWLTICTAVSDQPVGNCIPLCSKIALPSRSRITALHRRMTEPELRHALGDRIYEAFAPHGLLTQHDAEDPENLIHLGKTDEGEDVEINKRAATSDLLVYV